MTGEPLEHLRETRHLLNNHIQITQMQLQTIEQKMDDRRLQQDQKLDNMAVLMEQRHAQHADKITELTSSLKWAAGLVVSLVLAVLGWSLVQQYNANEATKNDLQQQVNLLKAQEAERNRFRDEIRSQLAPGAAQAPSASGGVAQP